MVIILLSPVGMSLMSISWGTEEKEIWLSAIYVDDGQWHTAKVSRYGSAAILTLDGGEGRRYNDTFVFKGHQVRSTEGH